ncbi:hypothetical protein [Pseudoxanthomonas sp. PXM01]|uniref:hypothetical protein n=1 Tax=Pseudoxanthomonas sp. PXM01 TaxID=2769295 RepID=UPI001CE21F93|nr:hypothetical protein [Pseudoxanthomonas sp. PXM01]
MLSGCAVAWVVLFCLAGETHGHEIDNRPVCEVVAATDRTIDATVIASEDLCTTRGWTCQGVLVRARDATDTEDIVFVTSAALDVGERYTLFLARLAGNRQVFLYNVEYRTFAAPEEAAYFLPFDGAFLQRGPARSRLLPVPCVGDGSDCVWLRRHAKHGSAAPVLVAYPSFDEDLGKCPR